MSTLSSIHNIAFVGHPSTGKTTLVDALAHLTGASPRKGSVADRTSICDTEPEEHERHHTLHLSMVYANWGERDWTFLDTPGYPEFMAQAQSAMFAADLVVGVVSCSSGASYNLRSKMATAAEVGRGRAIVVTHLDAENADFDTIVEQLRAGVGEVCVPVLLPNASGHDFADVHRTMRDPESPWCQRLKDRVMDACEDEALLESYFETQELSEEQLDQLTPNAIAKGTLVPVLVCNPQSGLGVDAVLEYLRRFAPTPATGLVRDTDGNSIPLDPQGLLSGTVFSVISDPHVGKLCMARVHRGTLGAHDQVQGSSNHKPEKLGGLFRLVGKKREAVEQAGPGDLVAFTKVEHLGTWANFGHTSEELIPVPTPRTPTPMVAQALVPKSRNDESKIGEALHKLEAEDPTFQVEHTQDTHEIVAHGMSELHLQVVLERLERRYGVSVETHVPRISYRQTITQPAEGHHRHKKQSGGRGQFGECYLRVRPGESGSGFVFEDKVVGGSIPRNLIPAVEKGIREICSRGILIDGEVVDVVAELYDGKFHAVDSDEASFKMAGARAFRDGFEKGRPVLLEPVLKATIRVPTDDAGQIFSDLTSHRRGHVHDQQTEDGGATTVIVADVPLSTMQTYARDLKSMTAGEGSYEIERSGFAPMPASEQQRLLAEGGKRHEDE